MLSTKVRAALVCLVIALGLASVALAAAAGHPKRPSKPRCSHKLVHHGAHARPATHKPRHRSCKRRKPPHRVTPPVPLPPPPPLGRPADTPTVPGNKAPAGPTNPGNPGNPGDPTPTLETVDWIDNPGFEDAATPTGCFAPFNASDGKVSVETAKPITGSRSLHLEIKPFGRIGCIHDYGGEGPKARSVSVEGDLRIDNSAAVEVCAIEYYADSQEPHQTCKTFASSGGKVVHVALSVNGEDRFAERAFFQLKSPNEATAQATLDNAHLRVESVLGTGGPRGGGGGGGGGSSSECQKAIEAAKEPAPHGPPNPKSPCFSNETPKAGSGYTPTAVNLRPARPYISLDDYAQIAATSPVFRKFKSWVDDAVVRHSPGFAYTSGDAVLMFFRSKEAKYIDDAIARVDAEVKAAEAQIAKGERPEIASDDYLNVGVEIEELALTYDYGFSRLTPDQRQRWLAYGEQAVSNLWSPATATWGSNPAGAFSWSGWSINNPGNNYNFSFIEATQMWALATQSQPWIDFLQTYKFPLITAYYSGLPGGGSREGTGYGAAQKKLWENARIWRDSTGEDLPAVRKHARESIEYWLNATVPTLDFYAPIGDLSRESMPNLYDYHENLIQEAVFDSAGSAEARHGAWWLANNSVPELRTGGFNLRSALLVVPDAPQAPTALTYNATGTGHFFARSSWSPSASWLQFSAGPYEESHAHEDQGAFNLYRGSWLAATANIFSGSGLQGSGTNQDLGVGASNNIRFTQPGVAGGPVRTIEQNHGVSTITTSPLGANGVKVQANLSSAYSGSGGEVRNWTRELEFQNDELRVKDACQVAADVTPVFQVDVPVQPTSKGNGVISAGKLEIVTAPTAQVKLVEMHSLQADFQSGWRVDIVNPSGCGFDVNLKTLP